MPTIFFSYRRADSNAAAVRILERLKNFYGKDEVRTDIETVSSRVERRAYVLNVEQDYAVLVLAIGPRWLDSHTQAGQRRLEDPDDIVRLEIEAALQLRKPIIPILLRQAPMPTAEQLPDTMKPLATIEPIIFRTDLDFIGDMKKLYRLLAAKIAPQRDRRTAEHVDASEPDAARQQYLRVLFRQNVDANQLPYANIRLETLGELDWMLRTSGGRSGTLTLNKRPPADLRGVRLDHTNLSGAELAGVNLSGVDLTQVDLSGAHLTGANLTGANLAQARLSNAQLDGADLTSAVLSLTDLSAAVLRKAQLADLDLQTAMLHAAELNEANLSKAKLNGVDLSGAKLTEADLTQAILRDADLSGADLTAAVLEQARLENADLSGAHMQGANLAGAHLDRANLSQVDLTGVSIDTVEALKPAILDPGTRLGAVSWGGVTAKSYRQVQDRDKKLRAYRDVGQVNHDIAEMLRNKGLLAEASSYHLEQEKMRRRILRATGNYPGWVFSWLLNLISGYGERLGRTVLTYLAVVGSFAAAYFITINVLHAQASTLEWYQALALSLSSFHGRGFISPSVSLGDPLATIAAIEAVTGLFIELIFIASFSRRFLGN